MTVEFKGSASPESQRIAKILRRSVYPFIAGVATKPDLERYSKRYRAVMEPLTAAARPPRGTKTRQLDLGGFRGELTHLLPRFGPRAAPGRIVLYFHGGAFISGGIRSHRRISAQISRATGGIPVLSIAYRLMPQHSIGQSIADGLTAYDVLLHSGYAAQDVVFAGDSAGGNLVFSVAVAARERGLPMPAALVAMSPWADLDADVHLASPNRDLDAYLAAESISTVLAFHEKKFGPLPEEASPVVADLLGMPPTLIQVGSTEILRDDAQRLHDRLEAAGCTVTLQIWDKQFHVFQAWYDVIPEAREAVAEIATFITANLEVQD
ncbi:MAG: esterase [Nocardioidaceae bacterium]|nr:esterase [Nocardioidaceae bacterium]